MRRARAPGWMLALAVFTGSTSAWAEWVRVTEGTDRSVVYLDDGSISRTGGSVTVQVMRDFSRVHPRPQTLPITSRERYDRSQRTRQSLFHTSYNSDGSIAWRGASRDGPSLINADSTGEVILTRLCSRSRGQ